MENCLKGDDLQLKQVDHSCVVDFSFFKRQRRPWGLDDEEKFLVFLYADILFFAYRGPVVTSVVISSENSCCFPMSDVRANQTQTKLLPIQNVELFFHKYVYFTGKASCRFKGFLFWLLITMCTFLLYVQDSFQWSGSLWRFFAAQNKPALKGKEKWVWAERSAPEPEGGQHVPSLQWRKSIWIGSFRRPLLICLNLAACFLRRTFACCVCLTSENTSGTGTYVLIFTGYSEKRRATDASGLTIPSPKLNRFSLRLQSWAHVTYLGSVFFSDQWTKMGLLTLLCQTSNTSQQLMCCARTVCADDSGFISNFSAFFVC